MPVKVSASSQWQAYGHDSILYWKPYESNIKLDLNVEINPNPKPKNQNPSQR